MSSRISAAIAALAIAVAGTLVLAPVASVPARADGMEATKAPKVARPVVRTHRHVVHRRYHHAPLLGYEIKHLHDDVASPVYAMPAWPACQYVLDHYMAGPTANRYEGRYDCGS
jgi:hypothetical protein